MSNNQSYLSRSFFWFILVYAVAALSVFAATALLTYKYGAIRTNPGWNYTTAGRTFIVSEVHPSGPAANLLRTGDIIVAINGKTDFARAGIQGQKLMHLPPAQNHTLTILRDGVEQEVRLTLDVRTDPHQLISLIVLYAAAFLAFAIAAFVGLSRPDHLAAKLFAFTWLSASLLMLVPVIKPFQTFLQLQESRISFGLWLISISPMCVATGYHFYQGFPAGNERAPWSTIKYGLYVFTAALAGFFTVVRGKLFLTPEQGIDFFYRHHTTITSVERSIDFLLLIALPAICAVVAKNYGCMADLNLRRRMRWVVFGSVAGVLPFTIFSLLHLISVSSTRFQISEDLLNTLFVASSFALVFVPMTVGYAILRHRLFDIHVLVRRGVQYLFAKNFLRILIYLPVVLIALAIRANPGRSIPELIFSNTTYLLLLIAAVAALLFRKNVLEWVDRRFFRETYNSEQILLTLAQEIKNFNSMPEMARWVSVQLDTALHPKRILVFFRESERGGFELGYSSGNLRKDLYIREGSYWLQSIERVGHSQDVLTASPQIVPPDEKEWLQQIGAQLAVPMNGANNRINGVILLGEKKSEEPYSPVDRKLLEALAGQMGILHDNVRLREKVYRGEKVQREVLAHLSGQKRNLLKECPVCGSCFDSSSEVCEEDRSELVLTLPVERVIDGKYRLEKLIGRGGMGAVYHATDTRLNREVAIKVLVGSMFGDDQAMRRFEREAQASARLNHTNIIRVYDYGAIGEGAYIVMELCHGRTLRQVFQESGNLAPETLAQWFDELLDGISSAHHMGVIHRDLKPENVLITTTEEGNCVKILDFGLAKMKVLDATQTRSLTAPGSVVGTLHYMSPEQLVGGEIDERTDIFSIGVMVVEALTGTQPFSGNNATEVALAILQRPYTLEHYEEMNAIVQKCLAKNRDNRYRSVTELRKELIPALRRTPPLPHDNRKADNIPTKSI